MGAKFGYNDRSIMFGSLSARIITLDNKPYVLSVFKDITERKRAEEVLRESEGKFRNLAEKSFVGIYLLQDGLFKYVNARIADILGLKIDEMINILGPKDVVFPEDLPLVEESIRRRLSGELESTHYGFRICTKSREIRHVEVYSSRTVYLGKPAVIGTLLDATDRKQADEALRLSEAKFRALAESSAAAIFLIQDTKYIYVNPAFETMTRYTIDDLANMNFWDFVHPDFQELVRNRGLSRLKGQNPRSRYEIKFITKNGTERWADFSATIIQLDGRPTIIGSTFDITERKQAGEWLRESEEKYAAVVQNANDGVIILQDNILQFANKAMTDILGYTYEEMKNTPFIRYVAPGNRDMVATRVKERLSGMEVPRFYEAKLLHKDGTIIDAELSASVIHYRGKPTDVGIIRDISRRKHIEEELKRLSVAVEQAAEDVIITDTEGTIQYVNPAFEKITGYSRQEAIGQNPRIVKSGVHNAAFYENLWSTIKNGNVWTGRITNKRKDGTLIQEDATISPLLSSSGQITGYVSLKKDVTEIVRLEAQLRQAQKMEAIGTLAGGIAHDFNNILGAIMGYTDMALQDREIDNRLRGYLDQVYKAGNRAKELVKQILAFSRQSDEKPRPLRISPIIKEVLKLLRASLPSTIQIHQNIQSETDTVLAHPTQIHQILMNLCSNAAHAMRETKGELKVSLLPVKIKPHNHLVSHHGLTPGMYLKLTVSDTGVGIAPDIMDRIFDPFFTTKKPGEGTGMGLSVVYGIIKGYGGTINVESEVGKGTEFFVYLPLLMGTDGEVESEVAGNIVGGKERILFVDDEESLVQLGKEMLTRLGYEVVGRVSSMEAREVFRSQPDRFDLVITDMTMPNMTGIELAMELMRIRPNIPIILCTGFSEAISAEKAKRFGIRQFIMKPLIKHQIAAAIRHTLDQKGIGEGERGNIGPAINQKSEIG